MHEKGHRENILLTEKNGGCFGKNKNPLARSHVCLCMCVTCKNTYKTPLIAVAIPLVQSSIICV